MAKIDRRRNVPEYIIDSGPPLIAKITKWKGIDSILSKVDLWITQVEGGFTVKTYKDLQEEPFLLENNLNQILPDEIQVYENLLKAIKKQIDVQK